MIEKTRQLLSGISWNLVADFIMSRVERLGNIGNCPVIYIDSAGGRSESRNTLKDRYKEFANNIPPCIHSGFCSILDGNSNSDGKI